MHLRSGADANALGRISGIALRSGLVGIKRFEPFSVRRVFHQMAIVIRFTVRPPDGAAFTEGDLCRVNAAAGFSHRLTVAGAFGLSDAGAEPHQLPDKAFTLGAGQAGV